LVDPKTGLFAGGSGSGMLIVVFVVWKVFQLTGLQSFENPGLFPSTTLASRGVLCKTPPFPRKNSVSGCDSGRDRLIRVQSRLGYEIKAYSGLIPRSDGRVMIENYWEAGRVA